jgi:hypothetical protein
MAVLGSEQQYASKSAYCHVTHIMRNKQFSVQIDEVTVVMVLAT